jgi:hypothetical protein
MTAIVSVETVLLVLLVVLVAGLLRSHAELLRRLGPEESGVPGTVAAPPLARSGARGEPAPALQGSTPHGDPLQLSFTGATGTPTLLAFLTSGCSTCAGFWESLAERRLATGVQTVIVTRGSDRERPARLRSLAPPGVPVVMSSEAWDQYRVPGAPYFVLVDGEVRGEGVATSWEGLASLVSDAIEDQRDLRSLDETLAAAGIGPDHPSLYPPRHG